MNLLHCFQNTIPIKHEKFRADFSKIKGHEDIPDELLEVNFITAVKHLNNKKIDSHLYFFRGFCEYLEPEFCMLVDIGTKPLKQSINKLYQYMWCNDDIGGACGDMGVDLKIAKGHFLLNYAQYMEYLLSHYIDKAFEGFFSYQSVLPGAYSILRWDAIRFDPIEEFLQGLHNNTAMLSLVDLNKFLAEDRIMCY